MNLFSFWCDRCATPFRASVIAAECPACMLSLNPFGVMPGYAAPQVKAVSA
jgi:hypothetical protein